MRHGLVDAYLNLIEQYKNLNFGIYDDTPDLHRAICLSDAYYGDRSSLVALYQLTGKPVMIQDLKTDLASEQKIFLDFEGLYDDGNNLWFSTMYFNGLFKMNPKNMETKFVTLFCDENNYGQRLYTQIAEHTGKLYFAPFSASSIAVYDIRKETMNKISFDDKRTGELKAYFYDIIVYGDVLIFVPYGYNAILCYDVKSNEITYCDDWVNKVCNSHFFTTDFGYFRNGVLVGNKLYLPCISGGKMVIFDADTFMAEVVEITNEDLNFHGVCTDGKNLWIVQMNGSVFKWDIENRYGINIVFPYESAPSSFSNICLLNDKLILLPLLYSRTFTLDINTLGFDVVEEFKAVGSPIKSVNGHYLFSYKNSRYIYTYEMFNDNLVIYDIEAGKIHRKKIVLNEDIVKQLPICKIFKQFTPYRIRCKAGAYS